MNTDARPMLGRRSIDVDGPNLREIISDQLWSYLDQKVV